MRRLFALASFAVASLSASTALPCGGGFGVGLEVGPAQKIVVVHRDGEESYVFSPSFCGEAAEFGLILPIPGQLTDDPQLAEQALFDELDELTAPQIVEETVCNDSDGPSGGTGWSNQGGGSRGVEVVDHGQVGIFDWTLLQADTSAAFTDWLDANGYPYDSDTASHFDHYVGKTWYFVAFKVTAGQDAPPPGSELCGNLGPIGLKFASGVPIVPARIAAVGAGMDSDFAWRVFAFSDGPLTSDQTVSWEDPHFAGTITDAQLAQYPQLAQLAEEGDQLTALDLFFFGGDMSDDITLLPTDGPTEFRKTQYEYTYVECGPDGTPLDGDDEGCECSTPASAPPAGLLALGLGIGALGLLVRRRRSK